MSEKLSITAVIVSHNEGHMLDECLQSISFCSEILVYDLESTDDTRLIAQKYTDKVIDHALVPIVEIIRAEAIQICRYDWVLFLDPDERISPGLAVLIGEFMSAPQSSVGIVMAPWIFYFKRKRLKGTVWGVEKSKQFLFNRVRVILSGDVHTGTKLKNGFDELLIGSPGIEFITHFWSDSFRTLISKHRRYLQHEGRSRYNNGERYQGLIHHLRSSLIGFYSSYIYYRGYRSGLNGFLLSLIWCWYAFMSLNALRKFESRGDF